MQYQLFNLLGLAALASAATTSYDIETVTENSTTDVTITSCSGHPDCVAAEAVTSTPVESVVTTTIDGMTTYYTTVCDESSSSPEETVSPVAKAPEVSEPEPASSSSEEIVYIDLTTTPTVTASTGVEATVTQQSTLISSYSSANSSVNAVAEFEGVANNQQVMLGAAGFAGLAALLI